MNWKDMSITKKIGLGIGAVVLLLGIVSYLSYSGVGGILDNAQEVIEGNKLNGLVTQKEVDHLNWAKQVSLLFTDENVTQLAVEMNDHNCAFGKWLYGEGRKQAEAMVPELAPLFKSIEEPHQALHLSAATIKEDFKQDHSGLALLLSNRLTDHVNWVAKLGRSIAEEAGGLYTYHSLLKSTVQLAISRLRNIEARPDLFLTQKKQLAHDNLENLRFGESGNDYFFILDTEGHMIMHPHKPELNGTDVRESVDKKGMKLFSRMIEVAQRDESGFVTYYWPLPGANQIVSPKITYVRLFKPWNWIVCTGIYVDHTNEGLLKRVEEFASGKLFSTGLQLDPQQCAFGKFLSEKNTLKIMETFPELREALTAIREPHRKLHESAQEIEQAINDLNIPYAINIFQNQSEQLLSDVKTIFSKAIEAEMVLSKSKIKAEEIYATQTLSSLKKTQELMAEIRKVSRDNIMSDEQMLDKAGSTRMQVLLTGIVALGIGLLLTFVIAKSISKPIIKSVAFAQVVASGNLTQQLDIRQKDEIGKLISALNQMSQNLRQMFMDIASGTRTLTASSTELSTISEQISINSKQTAERSNNVSAAAEEMSTNMSSVAAATQQTTANIQMIVTAAEEMTATIQEVSKNIAAGSDTTARAVTSAREVSGKVDLLNEAALEINKVTDTIADISEQTNLLALNATIEAARAGESGKGFAVVAGEIKALAQQTAHATQEISSRIIGVQETTKESVEAINTIVNVINEIDTIVTSVATAIEEQAATTQEISGNVSQAAAGLTEVNRNVNETSAVAGEVTRDITQVSRATEEMNTGSQQIRTSSGELSRLAETLNEMVKRFSI